MIELSLSEAMLFALYRSLPEYLTSEEKSRIAELARIIAIVACVEGVDIGSEPRKESKDFKNLIFSQLNFDQCNQKYINDKMNCNSKHSKEWGIDPTIDREITWTPTPKKGEAL